ncbi:MAG: type IIL restriction-modification enzyme MmeI [Saprospiraceae bacterium]
MALFAGYEKRGITKEDPVNIKAAELMGKLHDSLEEVGYTGHALELYLVRLLFCLFADDTNIFNRGIFWECLDLPQTRWQRPCYAPGQHIHTLNTPRKTG